MELHLDTLRNQTVLVLGLGQSGLAMARWCARAGARVRVADTREQPPGLAALRAECPGAEFVAGPFDAALLAGVRRVLRSPGLSPAEIAPVLIAGEQADIRVEGEIDLFTEALATLRASAGYAPAVLAVTGTNGKTTVTALTGRLVERAGRTVAVAGNIGPTLLDTLSVRLDAGDLPAVWVLELSSFQLHGAQGFEPTAATVLNISQDHLDWHGSLDAYAADKARIFGREALMVLNRDDPRVMAMAAPPAPVPGAAGKGRSARPQPRAQVSFGAGLPQRPGDWGIESVGGMDWLVRALPADETRRRRMDAEDDLHIQRLMPADALRIAGRHNALNALAALALATAAGCPLAPMLHGLREYRGEPHRVESVAVVRDVEFIDDSKGTNVGATVAALTGLGAGGRRLVVILGGDGKGQDFSPLAPAVTAHARAVLLIGRDGPRIGEALASCGVPVEAAADMDAAVQRAAALARAGDAVLMSPACASLDMFRNYAHRAEVFRAAVARLALEAGVTLEGVA